MILFTQNLVKFTLFSLFFYAVSLIAWGLLSPQALKPNLNYRKGEGAFMYSRLQEAKEIENVDILFLGSSHAYRGFDNRMYSSKGYKTFNLGSSAQAHSQTLVLIKRYLERLNPKVVIYEVYPETFSNEGVESSLDIISNDNQDLSSLEMTLKINNIKTYNTFLFALGVEYIGLYDDFKESIVKKNDSYVSGGFVEKKISHFDPKKFEPMELTFSPAQIDAFTEVMALLKSKNIEVILVFAPISSVQYRRYTNLQYFDSLMLSYSSYYNFNEVLELEDSLHFYDSHHLNQLGVEVFNEGVLGVLTDDYEQSMSPQPQTTQP